MLEAFVLVGPSGAGKSYIGELMEREFEISFLRYEDIFISEYEKNPYSFLKRAEPLAERAIFDFLENRKRISFENTMARRYAIDILGRLKKVADVRLVYVDAPFETTLERISKRDQRQHLRWTPEELKKIYETCRSLKLDFDMKINNSASTSGENIVAQLNPLVKERRWFNDYVEIFFKGEKLIFNCWSGDSLTDYDKDYQPWKISFREENPQYIRYYKPKDGDVIVDAGAYKGTFTAYASKAVGRRGRVISFEPDIKNFRDLQETVELNGLNNVTLVNKALWSREKVLKFNSKHTAGASVFFNASPHMIEVSAITLDAELNRLGVDKVNFIKMDVEGSEIEALNGSVNTLTNNDAKLSVASYHVVAGQETAESVEELLRSLGYETRTEFPNHKITYGQRGVFGNANV